MRAVFVVLFLFASCGDVGEPIEVRDGILVSVKPQPEPGIWVSCELADEGKTCSCTVSECSAKGIEAMGEECWRLRHPIVVE